jgi:hypothetical protein
MMATSWPASILKYYIFLYGPNTTKNENMTAKFYDTN